GGNDILIGPDGTDTAGFSGNRADYAVSFNSALQTYTVADLRPGSPDGTDITIGIGSFRFADGTVPANGLAARHTRNPDSPSSTYHDDVFNQNLWSNYTQHFDAQGRLTSETDHYDDGTTINRYFDVQNINHWADYLQNFDPAGRLVAETDHNHDGTTTQRYFDAFDPNNLN